MSYWRFGASILAAFFGDILVGFGIFSLAEQIKPSSTALAAVMLICGYIGVIGLLGYGTVNSDISGIPAVLARYLAVSDVRLLWSAVLGMIGIG